jgi:hypothetical protein
VAAHAPTETTKISGFGHCHLDRLGLNLSVRFSGG